MFSLFTLDPCFLKCKVRKYFLIFSLHNVKFLYGNPLSFFSYPFFSDLSFISDIKVIFHTIGFYSRIVFSSFLKVNFHFSGSKFWNELYLSSLNVDFPFHGVLFGNVDRPRVDRSLSKMNISCDLKILFLFCRKINLKEVRILREFFMLYRLFLSWKKKSICHHG